MNGPYKRFLVLMDEQYYPSSGTGSVVASFDDLDEAIHLAKSKVFPSSSFMSPADYVEIFDCDERRVVWEAE